MLLVSVAPERRCSCHKTGHIYGYYNRPCVESNQVASISSNLVLERGMETSRCQCLTWLTCAGFHIHSSSVIGSMDVARSRNLTISHNSRTRRQLLPSTVVGPAAPLASNSKGSVTVKPTAKLHMYEAYFFTTSTDLTRDE